VGPTEFLASWLQETKSAGSDVCIHMSGLWVRSLTIAGQDEFRNARSDHSGGGETPVGYTECLASRPPDLVRDRSLHLLLMQFPLSPFLCSAEAFLRPGLQFDASAGRKARSRLALATAEGGAKRA